MMRTIVPLLLVMLVTSACSKKEVASSLPTQTETTYVVADEIKALKAFSILDGEIREIYSGDAGPGHNVMVTRVDVFEDRYVLQVEDLHPDDNEKWRHRTVTILKAEAERALQNQR
ncbi:MAG: hypothetical protein WBO92_01325 [Candidatus Moraniibacteriota bacterium]